jgi:hypothetical protein
MLWFRIRKAKISPKDREEFEQFGVATIQFMLASGNLDELNGGPMLWGGTKTGKSALDPIQMDLLFHKRPAALKWLVEQYDRQERKETWSITMEASITVFVLAELVLALVYRK